jgi:hypothetical protein
MNQKTVQRQIAEFVRHLEEVEQAFNAQADLRRLGVRLDVSDLVQQTKRGRHHRKILSFFSADRPGVLYREQIVTAVDAIVELIESPYNLGLVLGALQSGKTTTALALQFAGPAIYLVTGQRVFPFYLTTNQNSHEEQLRNELAHFIKYYGGIDVVFEGMRCQLKNYLRGHRPDPVFDMSPNLDTYREVILQGNQQFQDIFKPATLDDLIHKRVRGTAIRRLAQSCRRMVKAGFTPLMIVDEPQFGASDRLIRVGGGTQVVDCLLTQIDKELRASIGEDADNVKAIGLSATPFEVHALQRVWTVFQRLGSGYRGFNDFGGQPIDPTVKIAPPNTLSISDAATQYGIPFLRMVNPSAYARARSFTSFVGRTGYSGSWYQYQQQCVDAVRDLVLALASAGDPVGICLRAINDNGSTEQLLSDLRLPANTIEVVKFYGSGGQGMTVKQAIAARQRPDLPYLFLVTSKARMGDQFPSDVRYFIDFSQRASDLNSLLQGLVGRACGYGKQSTVILSDHNNGVLEQYVATHGDYVTKPSRHSIVAGGAGSLDFRRQLTVNRDPSDPVLEAFFQDLDRQVVQPNVPAGKDLRPKRAPKGGRRGPVLLIAEKHNVFDHIETASFKQSNLKHVMGTPEIVRRKDTVTLDLPGGKTVQGKYLTDQAGGCRYNFRNAQYAGRGGVKGRGTGRRDASNVALNAGILEPSLGLQKCDPTTGAALDTKNAAGVWVVSSITVPLKSPCLMGWGDVSSRVSLPGRNCVYDKYMTKRERAKRDGQ